jgi:hypothetical protein
MGSGFRVQGKPPAAGHKARKLEGFLKDTILI